MNSTQKTGNRHLAGNGERRTYSVDEAARILGLGRNAAYAAANSGQIPAIRIGGRLLIPREALEKLLQVNA